MQNYHHFSSRLFLFVALVLGSNSLHAQNTHPAATCRNCSLLSPKCNDILTASKPASINYQDGREILRSENDKYVLLFSSCRLVLRKTINNQELWSVPLGACGSNATLVMQNDGNLVFYGGPGNYNPKWSTDTYNHPERDGEENYLILQNDGNLVLYDWDYLSADDVLWASGTNQ